MMTTADRCLVNRAKLSTICSYSSCYLQNVSIECSWQPRLDDPLRVSQSSACPLQNLRGILIRCLPIQRVWEQPRTPGFYSVSPHPLPTKGNLPHQPLATTKPPPTSSIILNTSYSHIPNSSSKLVIFLNKDSSLLYLPSSFLLESY